MSRIMVMAKAPVAGRVKTRLCPPCTPQQAADVAAAALADTLDTVTATATGTRVLVVHGDHPAPPGWLTHPQRGRDLGERLAHAFADAGDRDTLLVGMDTPQLTPDRLAEALRLLADHDAVLGPAVDGGWWGLGLRDPRHAEVLAAIATSTPRTGAETAAALRGRGLRLALLPKLSDVDTITDAGMVAALCRPESRFARTVATVLARPATVGAA
jgi:uncharacterized protein